MLQRNARKVNQCLKASGFTEGTNDGGDVALFDVDLRVEAAHVDSGEFSGEIGEGGAKLREFGKRRLAHDGNGVVRREVVEVVFERD
jgi:hypothetical protein